MARVIPFDQKRRLSTDRHFSETMTAERRARVLKIAEEFFGLSGDIAEFGVYRGDTALAFKDIMPTCKTLHLFDTFSGLPEPGPLDGSFVRPGMYCYDLASVVDHVGADQTIFHVGAFHDQVAFNRSLCFAHVDADLYRSTLDALEIIDNVLVDGGGIIVDDFGSPLYPGVSAAVLHFNPSQGVWARQDLPGHCLIIKCSD